MATDAGTLVVGVRVNTKQLEKDLNKSKKELEKYQQEAEQLVTQKETIEINLANYDKITQELDNLKSQFEDAKIKYQQILQSGATGMALGSANDKVGELRAQINEYQQKVEQLTPEYEKQVQELNIINTKIQDSYKNQQIAKNSVSQITNELQKQNKTLDMSSIKKGFGELKHGADIISGKISGIVRKVVFWGLALFGIRRAYSFIQQSISTISGYNDQIKTDVAYMKFALATTLQPIVEYLVKLAYKLMAIIGAIIKTFTGYNIFQNATIDNFKKTQGAIDGANKSAKEFRKTLAGFDEMNILEDASSSSGSGGGSEFTMPSIDLSSTDLFKDWNLETALSKLADGINNFFETTDFKGIAEWLGNSFVYVIDNITMFLQKVNWEKVGESVSTFLTSLPWDKIVSALLELVKTLIVVYLLTNKGFWDGIAKSIGTKIGEMKRDGTLKDTIIDVGKTLGKLLLGSIVGGFVGTIWESMVNCASELLTTLCDVLGFGKTEDPTGKTSDKFKNTGKSIGQSIFDGIIYGLEINLKMILLPFTLMWNLICDLFGIHSPSTKFKGLGENMIQGLINGITGMIGKLKTLFSNIATTIANAVGDTFKAVINTIIGFIESKINSAINNINGLIRIIKNLPVISGLTGGIGTIGKVSLPRLAKGGIINQPSRGVMVGGSAIGGEDGAEGVIPLTDSQQMAIIGEAIGRYVTIYANITNTMNGRVISKELQRINNESDFAYNR